MRWPWVGVGRLEDAQRELATVRAERDRYLDRLLEAGSSALLRNDSKKGKSPLPAAQIPLELDTRAEDAGLTPVRDEAEVAANVAGSATPFDRLSSRFRQAHSGRPPERQYRVRA